MADQTEETILNEAYRLQDKALRAGAMLDESAMWIMTMDGWRELRTSLDMFSVTEIKASRRKEFLGLRLRITTDDEPDAPRLQLVLDATVRR